MSNYKQYRELSVLNYVNDFFSLEVYEFREILTLHL